MDTTPFDSDPEYIRYSWSHLGIYNDVFTVSYGFLNETDKIVDCVVITLGDEMVGKININSDKDHFKVKSSVQDPKNIMHVYVDANYNGLGLAKVLMKYLVNQIKQKYKNDIDNHTVLSIVGDATGGYWEHIGMKGDDDYKEITIGKLEEYLDTKRTLIKKGKRLSSKEERLTRQKKRRLTRRQKKKRPTRQKKWSQERGQKKKRLTRRQKKRGQKRGQKKKRLTRRQKKKK